MLLSAILNLVSDPARHTGAGTPAPYPMMAVQAMTVAGGSTARAPVAVVVAHPEVLDDPAIHAVAQRKPAWVSIAIDGADAAAHDGYRGVPGGFQKALLALDRLRNLGIDTRVLTHVRRHNHRCLERIVRIARWFTARRWTATFSAAPGLGSDDALTADERTAVRCVAAGLATACAPLAIAIEDERLRPPTALVAGHHPDLPALPCGGGR